MASMRVRTAVVVVLVLCWAFAAGGGISDDSGRSSLTKKRNAMIDFHDSLAKFASSLRNFQRKGQQVLDAAVAEEGGGGVLPQAPEDGRHAVSEDNGLSRSRRHHGRGLGDVGVDAEDGGPFNPNAYATHSAEDLVQKRDDESVRVIRIKILHHGRDNEEDYHSGVARRLPPKTTPCPVSHLVTAARRRATAMTARTDKTSKIGKKSSAAMTSTTASVAYCAQDDTVKEVPQELEDHKDDRNGLHNEEPHGHDEDKQVASGNEEAHADAQPSRDVHEPHTDGDGVTNAEDNGSLGAEYAESETTKIATGTRAKPFKLHSRGDHLRIHIVHRPSNPQADVNETFFANHSFVNKTGHDVLMVKTDDHFFATNGSRVFKVREADRHLFPAGVSFNNAAILKNEEQQPYLVNQDYVEEFEKRVKRVNESLQRIRNYRQPPKAKIRSRRENVRSMRSLRFAPSAKRAVTPSRKADNQNSHVIGASSGNIRIIFNRRADNEKGAQEAVVAKPAPIIAEANGGVKLRHNIRVLDPLSRKVSLKGMAKRYVNETTAQNEQGDDVVNVVVNNSNSNEPSMAILEKPVTRVSYVQESGPVVSKYEQFRFRAIALTAVLAAAAVFSVSAVSVVLYFDLNRLVRFVRSFNYTALDMSSPIDDDIEEVYSYTPTP